MPPNLSVNIYEWGQMYKILIFSKYISNKKEIKVNNLTPDYGQNLIYPLVVLKFDPHYANIPICFIPQVSPFHIVEKVN